MYISGGFSIDHIYIYIFLRFIYYYFHYLSYIVGWTWLHKKPHKTNDDTGTDQIDFERKMGHWFQIKSNQIKWMAWFQHKKIVSWFKSKTQKFARNKSKLQTSDLTWNTNKKQEGLIPKKRNGGSTSNKKCAVCCLLLCFMSPRSND